MKYLSLFSGIEAASLAWEPLGWEPMAFCENEAFPSAVLAARWPDVPNLGDVTAVDWEAWLEENGVPDVLVAGAPCQAFSVAGNRRSLEDARGNLTLFTAELVRLMFARGLRFFVFENVPGILTPKDNPFGCFLGELVGAGEPLKPAGKRWTGAGLVSGSEARAAWRVLDAQFFAVAQRRARLFACVCPRDGADPAQVLLEFPRLHGHLASSREARPFFAGAAGAGTTGGRLLADSGVVRGLKARFGTSGADLDDAEAGHLVPAVAGTVSRKWSKGSGGPAGDEAYNLVADSGPWWDGSDVSECLDSSKLLKQQTMPDKGRFAAVVEEPLAFSCKDSGDDITVGCAPTLRAMPERPGVAFNGGGQIAVASATEQEPKWSDDLAFTVKQPSPSGGGQPQAVAFTGDGEVADPIGANEQRTYTNEGGHNFRMHNAVAQGMAVRRLTPRECERLQGMPDNHTRIPWRGKVAEDCPDGPRYKAIGNSMAVPCMAWIGRRIAALE